MSFFAILSIISFVFSLDTVLLILSEGKILADDIGSTTMESGCSLSAFEELFCENSEV